MDSRTTHHDRILAALRDKITGGDWPPGFQLPFETDLAEQHGVSRMTMNKVLGQLTREGFLLRRKKLGTFVAQPMAQAAIMAIPDIQAEVEALGLPWRFALTARDMRAPRPDEIKSARIDTPAPVLALTGLHYAGDQPFCLEHRIINPAAAPDFLGVDFATTTPTRYLLEHAPLTEASYTIEASLPSPQEAECLSIAPGAPCLVMTRCTVSGPHVASLARLVYPGLRYSFNGKFQL